MKKCPYCAEDIQDAAIKCKHCGEFLDGQVRPPPPLPAENRLPWYYRTAFIVLMLASVGPFALPLIWWHPKMQRAMKLLVTLIILIITALLTAATAESVRIIKEFYEMMKM